MQCRKCGTEIAEKALICYRCGTATTEAKFKPADIGKARRSRTLLWIVIAVVLALLVLAAFLLVDSRSPDLKVGPTTVPDLKVGSTTVADRKLWPATPPDVNIGPTVIL